MLSTISIAAGILALAGLAAWHIHASSLDVIYADTWGYVGMIGDYLSGRLDLAQIWTPHWQNRPVLLNLVLLMSARFDSLNVKHIEYLGVVFAALTVVILVVFCRRLFEDRMWTALFTFLVVAALVLSLAQWENFLLAINFVFFATTTFSVLAILLINRHLIASKSGRFSWPWAAAIACGELALLSSAAGAMQWAINVVQMLWFSLRFGRRVGVDLVCYFLVAAASVAAYLYRLDGYPQGWLQLPGFATVTAFLLTGIGNSLVGFFRNQPLVQVDIVAGSILCLLYGFAIAAHCRSPIFEQQRTTGLVCLIFLGIGEQLLIGLGRMSYGTAYSAASRYSSLTLISAAASLLLVALCAKRSLLGASAGVFLGLMVVACVAFSDYQEWHMANARRAYSENLKEILLGGRIGDGELRLLQWEDAQAVDSGNRILRRYHLSFYRSLP